MIERFRRLIGLSGRRLEPVAASQRPVGTTRMGLARCLNLLADRSAILQHQREAELLDCLSRRPHRPAYASRSTLESLVLAQARLKLWGVKAVMLDYAKSGTSEGINWRVVGFISGTADRDAATFAIADAARKYAMWIMVDDADPLAGRMVKTAAGGMP